RVSRLVASGLWPRVVATARPGWRAARVALLIVACAGFVLALARPQWGLVREKVEREGVDVVLALDTSLSMAAEDVSPSRFFLARAALASLVARLPESRFALLAFEGEAYPLVPLTLDADAVLLFLDTLEPGFVPRPGSSLGAGLEKGLALFADRQRRHKVMVLVSDGENLEGEVTAAARRARELGVVVHAVGVGTEAGGPVPEHDGDGRRTGFKRDEAGQVVVSRLDPGTLETIARATGGSYVKLTPQDTSLQSLTRAIEGLEEKALAAEFAFRRKERYQLPLAIGVFCLGLALLVPMIGFRRRAEPVAGPMGAHAANGRDSAPRPRSRFPQAGAFLLLALSAGPAFGQASPAAATSAASEAAPETWTERARRFFDEVLLRPTRRANAGRAEYAEGNHPKALEAFSGSLAARPDDPAARFNLGAALHKNGKVQEAAPLFEDLAGRGPEPLRAAAAYNRGNGLFESQDFAGAVEAYKHALRATPGDEDARRNLELALRELKQQEQQQKQDQDKQDQDQKQDKKNPGEQGQDQKPQQGDEQEPRQPQPGQQKQDAQGQPQPSPQTPEQRERERFEKAAGMPKERAMALLDALAQNEKEDQKKQRAAQRAKARVGRDW
ncbi:MAG: VWA domain-containing protein, partial [Vicinamibacteria bacterium]|nr:VWA domain-containing protein [Vicinamibacteria bacterium]